MRDEACQSFRDGTAGERCEGVDSVPPFSHYPLAKPRNARGGALCEPNRKIARG